jgi:hypothetical protein
VVDEERAPEGGGGSEGGEAGLQGGVQERGLQLGAG